MCLCNGIFLFIDIATTVERKGDDEIVLPKELILSKSSIHNLKLVTAGMYIMTHVLILMATRS